MVHELSCEELKTWMDADRPLRLLDVRSEAERDICSLPGAVQLTQEVMDDLLALEKQTAIVLHCHHGGRSLQAAQFLVGHGFTDVYNVSGGIDRWSLAVDTTVPRY